MHKLSERLIQKNQSSASPLWSPKILDLIYKPISLSETTELEFTEEEEEKLNQEFMQAAQIESKQPVKNPHPPPGPRPPGPRPPGPHPPGPHPLGPHPPGPHPLGPHPPVPKPATYKGAVSTNSSMAHPPPSLTPPPTSLTPPSRPPQKPSSYQKTGSAPLGGNRKPPPVPNKKPLQGKPTPKLTLPQKILPLSVDLNQRLDNQHLTKPLAYPRNAGATVSSIKTPPFVPPKPDNLKDMSHPFELGVSRVTLFDDLEQLNILQESPNQGEQINQAVPTQNGVEDENGGHQDDDMDYSGEWFRVDSEKGYYFWNIERNQVVWTLPDYVKWEDFVE